MWIPPKSIRRSRMTTPSPRSITTRVGTQSFSRAGAIFWTSLSRPAGSAMITSSMEWPFGKIGNLVEFVNRTFDGDFLVRKPNKAHDSCREEPLHSEAKW